MNENVKRTAIVSLLAVVAAGIGIGGPGGIRETVSAAPAAATTATASTTAAAATDRLPAESPRNPAPAKRQQRGTESCRLADDKSEEVSRPRSGQPTASDPISETVQGGYTVVISGGFDTDPQDHGRPVVLIAAALGVPTEVFREAFSGVTPAGPDRGPTGEEAQRNKAALMAVLAPYGITNDRLDEVSNYYRYSQSKGEVWNRTPATAVPVLTEDGKLTGVNITNAGSGYSSAPKVTIAGPDGTVTAAATVAYTDDFRTNGSLSAITLSAD